jgi:hypothetical protein
MVNGVRFLRRTERTWILTRDGSLGAFSKAFPELGDYPLSISLETLVNLLAVNDSGTEAESTDFGHVFAAIAAHRVFPGTVMQVEDLTRLIDVEAQFAELPADEIDSMARRVNKLRFDGASDGDVAIEINRTFQRYKRKFETQLEEQKRESSITKNLLCDEATKNQRLAQTLRGDMSTKLRRRYHRELALEILGCGLLVALSVALILLLTGLYSFTDKPDGDLQLWIGVGVNLLSTVILEIVIFGPNALKRYRDKKTHLGEIVEQKIQSVMGGTT